MLLASRPARAPACRAFTASRLGRAPQGPTPCRTPREHGLAPCPRALPPRCPPAPAQEYAAFMRQIEEQEVAGQAEANAATEADAADREVRDEFQQL